MDNLLSFDSRRSKMGFKIINDRKVVTIGVRQGRRSYVINIYFTKIIPKVLVSVETYRENFAR